MKVVRTIAKSRDGRQWILSKISKIGAILGYRWPFQNFILNFHPQIKWDWDYGNGTINLKIQQLQDHHVFQFPLEIGVVKDGKMTIETITVSKQNEDIQIESENRPDSIVLDPNEWTLFEDMGRL